MENYKTDLAVISEKEQMIVSDLMVSVKDNTLNKGGVFIKSNFENLKISARRSEPYIKKLLAAVFVEAATLSGIKNEIDQPNASDITALVFNKHSNLTVEEICKAFQMERHLEFGEATDHFQLFNAQYVATILKKYVDWKRQTMHQQNIQLPSNQNQNQVSPEDIRTVKIAGILDCFEDFLVSGKVDDFRFNVFDMLYSAGMLPKTGQNEKIDARYSQIKTEAQEQLILEIGIARASVKSKDQAEDLKNIYSEVKSGFGNALDNRTKAIVLANYFKRIKEKETLMELIRENLEKI